MSRIGKKPIVLPANVTVKVEGNLVMVKGPKGELQKTLPAGVVVAQTDNILSIDLTAAAKQSGETALWGLARALVNNLVIGVSEGFNKNLIMQGVGYRAALKGADLELNLGYSHPINMKLPAGISVQVEKGKLMVSGADKEIVGETAARIRQLRLPEPYKGSGIRYEDEVIIRKAGKKAATAAG